MCLCTPTCTVVSLHSGFGRLWPARAGCLCRAGCTPRERMLFLHRQISVHSAHPPVTAGCGRKHVDQNPMRASWGQADGRLGCPLGCLVGQVHLRFISRAHLPITDWCPVSRGSSRGCSQHWNRAVTSWSVKNPSSGEAQRPRWLLRTARKCLLGQAGRRMHTESGVAPARPAWKVTAAVLILAKNEQPSGLLFWVSVAWAHPECLHSRHSFPSPSDQP